MNTLIWAKVHLALYYLTKMPEKKKLIDFFSLKKKRSRHLLNFVMEKNIKIPKIWKLTFMFQENAFSIPITEIQQQLSITSKVLNYHHAL